MEVAQVDPGSLGPSRSSRRRSDDDYDNTNNGSGGQNTNSEQVQGPKANIENVDEYMELLYDDDMKIKVKGTAMIMDLARDAGNLEALIQNESLMGALSRVLKEDYKKSMDLTTNLMYIFFSFSNFTQMHGALTNYRVGAETMRVIDLEVRRHALRMKENTNDGSNSSLARKGRGSTPGFVGTVTGMQPSRQEEERQEENRRSDHDDKSNPMQAMWKGKGEAKVTITRPTMEKTKAVITKIKAEVAPYRTNRLILNVNETK